MPNAIKKIKKVKLATILEAGLIFLAIYLILVGIVIYYPWFSPLKKNKIVEITVQYVPYPVAVVGTHFIPFSQLSNELLAVKNFYQNQDFSKSGMRVDFSTLDGRKRIKIKEKNILEKLIDNAVIEAEAKKRGINLTPGIVNEEVDRKLKEYGTGDYLRNNLKRLYGWNLKDFKKNIVEPDMYKTLLFAKIRADDPSYAMAKKKIEKAQTELANGKKFSEVAKTYSDGQSAQKGGELGWFNASQMIPEVAVAVFSLKKGQRSKIIESSIGYHIVKVEDKKSEKNVPMVKVSQIFIRTKPFSEWLFQTEKKEKIFIPIQEFRWNSQTAQLEFRDSAMNKFEQDLLKNPSNDPSMIF